LISSVQQIIAKKKNAFAPDLSGIVDKTLLACSLEIINQITQPVSSVFLTKKISQQ
jgi:hypothetical protein